MGDGETGYGTNRGPAFRVNGPKIHTCYHPDKAETGFTLFITDEMLEQLDLTPRMLLREIQSGRSRRDRLGMLESLKYLIDQILKVQYGTKRKVNWKPNEVIIITKPPDEVDLDKLEQRVYNNLRVPGKPPSELVESEGTKIGHLVKPDVDVGWNPYDTDKNW